MSFQAPKGVSEYVPRTTYEFDHALLGAQSGIRADMAYGHRGLKGAMKAADRSGARFAVLIGAEERNTGTVAIKDLKTGDQQNEAVADAVAVLLDKLS